jgi:RNA exonuclease NGL2
VEKLLPSLHTAGYSDIYAAGPGKRHGCMIAYSNKLFEPLQQSVVEYDTGTVAVYHASKDQDHKGCSRSTRNIGLITGLRRRDQPTDGYIVATTHLFWHPASVVL